MTNFLQDLKYSLRMLATGGIYGVSSNSVSQHTQEVGIRMALGATPFQVLLLVIRQGMALVAIGVAIGLAGSFGLAQLLANLLYGVQASNPLTFASVSLVLVAVALIATFISVRRAAKGDPLVALRYQ
jgi:putative ABC transport system permease protein